MGTGSTPLATAGAALSYLDFSFAANSTNTKTTDGLVKLEVIWTANSAPEYFTIDVSGLWFTTPPSPTDKNHCNKDGWKTFNNPTFKNQGDCVSSVEKQKDNGRGNNNQDNNNQGKNDQNNQHQNQNGHQD
jgi:hypothetical protein